MVVDKNILNRIICRWLFINLPVAVFLFFWHVQVEQAIIIMFLTGTFSIYLILIYQKKSVKYKIEKHPLDYTLQIASETLPYLRKGLNEETAAKIAEIIQKITDVSAVAITDKERVLSYIGAGSDHHKAGGPILTEATKEALTSGQLKIVENRRDLKCPVPDCPLETAVIAPLKCKGEVVGTVKLYQVNQGRVPAGVIKLAVGIAQLLGMQMELAEVSRQEQLVTKAKLEALQAQINPHFLFNTLNTIIMFSRTDPEITRRLLIRLATFFRYALKRNGHFNTLQEEIEYVNTYLFLERARFQEKLNVIFDIDENLKYYLVPVLTIQPLVENAIKHGILPKTGQGTVRISASSVDGEMLIVIRDDGVGIEPQRLPEILKPGVGSGNGVGLSNVNERLKSLFGEDHALRIISVSGKGTSVFVRIPLMHCSIKAGREKDEAQSINC